MLHYCTVANKNRGRDRRQCVPVRRPPAERRRAAGRARYSFSLSHGRVPRMFLVSGREIDPNISLEIRSLALLHRAKDYVVHRVICT